MKAMTEPNMSLQYFAPSGARIVGTAESVLGTAKLYEWERDETGNIVPVWTGYTEVHWDAQITLTDDKDGSWILIDEEGEEWPQSVCELREVDDA
jgi:hypothetical protein